jgi:cation diffusion facilitator family transporter
MIGKLGLALNQWIMARKAQSAMLKANAQNMTADIVVSVSVLAGIGLSIYFKTSMIDSIAALLVGLWVIKGAVSIFLEANAELMDGGLLPERYRDVFEAVHSVNGALNPHRTRIRSIAGYLDIMLDIEVDGSLQVREAHRIAEQVEQAIRTRVENVFDVMIHVEPAGAGEAANEVYGLKEDSLK